VLAVPNTLLSAGSCGAGEDDEPGGGVAASESAPAPLTANDPAPEHGSPVTGFDPVVSLVSAPGCRLGVTGETEISGCAGRIRPEIGFVVCAGNSVACTVARATVSAMNTHRFIDMVDFPTVAP